MYGENMKLYMNKFIHDNIFSPPHTAQQGQTRACIATF